MNRKTLILFSILMGFVISGYAQNKEEKPEWAKQSYRKEAKNSYLETIVVPTEVTRDAMFQKAKEMLVERRKLATGERVIFSDGETKSQSGLTVYSQLVYEYIDYEKEIGYFLFQTLKKTNLEYERVEYTEKYPFSARVFVPGMAQIHKGSTTKGVLFISGEVLMIGGIVVAESMRSSYLSKVNSTHNSKIRQSYINKANTMQNVRNGFIAGAAAVYVWNVIDGAVAKGKKHIMIGENQLNITPYFTPEVGGFYLSVNF